MTNEQLLQMKIISYANWVAVEKFGGEPGIRDINVLKQVVSLPGNQSLICLHGEKLLNRRDLYNQLGWFVHRMIDLEPFNSNNRRTVLIILLWVLQHYHISFDIEELRDFIANLDTLRQGNTDISTWFNNNCR